MLHPLLVDFDFDLVLLTEVLEFSLFVSELCLLVFQLLFANDPEVVDPLTFILIEASQVLLLPDFLLQCPTLDPE